VKLKPKLLESQVDNILQDCKSSQLTKPWQKGKSFSLHYTQSIFKLRTECLPCGTHHDGNVMIRRVVKVSYRYQLHQSLCNL
jgi:hypothetical protein